VSSKQKSVVNGLGPHDGPTVQVARYSGLLRVSDSSLVAIAQRILGTNYHLSIVVCGDARTQTLNSLYRGKNTPANVLSFPLDTSSGEIFLNAAKIQREAKKFDLSPKGHLQYLLIHGCLHLKGYAHGSTMDRAEKKFREAFCIR